MGVGRGCHLLPGIHCCRAGVGRGLFCVVCLGGNLRLPVWSWKMDHSGRGLAFLPGGPRVWLRGLVREGYGAQSGLGGAEPTRD